MLRVKNEETAEFLTSQLPPVRVFTKIAATRVTDDNNPESPTVFVSNPPKLRNSAKYFCK